ncbi:RNA-directed DNA polymerase from mobile element jockey [Eumeta japonica]|uniref:RNA-directed DNA polymerase from mobile element jockey n=1 Tax=Eumeta variegata TaxID=151549 RepID=A0A4C1W5C3_EUMVA|nr:RNA-directed DNA polymerase from mobile element jockey [Eumeta japonica]
MAHLNLVQLRDLFTQFLREKGFTCEEDSINALIHPLEIVRASSPSPSASGKRAASVLSDDGSSGSDSTIRGSEAEDQDHFKVVRSKCLRKRANRFKRHSQSSSIMEVDQPLINPSNQMDSPASPDPAPIQDKDYRNLTRLLINGKIPFHTHPLDEERKIKAVIKGIPLEFQTDEVKNDLVNQGFPICSVHRLHGRDGRPLSLLLAVLNKTNSAKEMCKNLSKVCGLSGITVEPPYKKGGPGQCHRCQNYGHAAVHCYAQPRCVKCTVPHWTKECTRTRESDDKPSCEFQSASVPVRNAWFRDQPPRAAPEPTKGSTRPKPSGSALVNDKSTMDYSLSGKDWGRPLSGHSQPSGYLVSTRITIMSEAPGCSNHCSAGRLKAKNLKQLSFNARGLTNNRVELDVCAKEYSLDIILVQESFLKPHLRKACKLRNYVQLRKDRQGTSGGGTVLYYKRSLHCCPMDTPPLINLEATACKLAMSGHGTLIIVSVYLPSSKQLLQSDLESLLALCEHVILFGDFNSKNIEWNCVYTNTNGRILADLRDTLEFDVIAPLTPTHFPDKDRDCPDILDIALLRNVNLKLGCIETLQRLSSDHCPVLMRLGPTSDNRPRDKKITTNWKKVPVNSDHLKLPASVLKLIRAKNAALRRTSVFSHFPTPANRSYARALQRKVRERIREVRNNNWSALMEGITPTHKAYWQVVKALKLDGYELVPALKNPDNTLAFEDREKAECLANSIERQCLHTSPLMISYTHLGLRRKKAPGLDGMSNKAIKCFSSPLLALLVAIFNACLKNCYFPEVCKDAVIIGIPKPGKPRALPASYRPISLLSSLVWFRPHHSCPQQALRLVEYISEGFERKHKTVAVFFDVAKAFDRDWHAGLIHKLYTLEVPDRLVLIIHKYISNRHFVFRHKHTISSKKILRAGVPQGSTLSPLLYSAYTNDIPRPKTGVQLALFADDTTLFLRSASFNHIIPRLQRAINELTQWFQLWRIEVNSEKSAAIYFDFSDIKRTLAVPYNAPTLRISNAPIPWRHNYKYLGITLDKHLHFRDHIQRVRKLAIFYMSRLSSMIGRKSKMSLCNKRTLYTMFHQETSLSNHFKSIF